MTRFFFLNLFLCIYTPAFYAQIKLILTSALVSAHYEYRKKQYVSSFEILRKYGFNANNIYVVEAIAKQAPTFLNDYSNNVFYSTVNNPHIKNHGSNEAKTLLEALYYFNFDPEDMIIKHTGRHHFMSDSFLKTVQENEIQYDAIVRAGVHGPGVIASICFAMKNKYLQEMLENADYEALDAFRLTLETVVTFFVQKMVKKGDFKVLYVDTLDICADTTGSTTAPGATMTIYF